MGPNATAALAELTPLAETVNAPCGGNSESPRIIQSMALPRTEEQPAGGVSEPGETQPPGAAADPEAALEALQKNRACRNSMTGVLARIQERLDANAVLQRKVKLLIKASREAMARPKEVDVGVRTPNLDWPGRKKPERTRTSCSRIFVGSDGTGPEENPDIDRVQPLHDVLASCVRDRRWTDGEKEKLGAAVRTHVKELWTEDMMAAVQREGRNATVRLSALQDGLAELKERHVTDADLATALPRVNWERVFKLAQLGARTPEDCRACWTVQCAPGINRGEWTAEEDGRLRELVAKHEGHDWEAIATELGNGRTAAACLVRFQRDLRTGKQQSNGSAIADAQGTPPIEAEGRPGSVQLWPGRGRPPKQKSAPFRKQTWNEEENLRLRYAVAAFGTGSWVHVAEIVGTRTDPQCRERWMNVLDPSVDSSPWTEEEDARLEALVLRLGAGKWAQLAEEFNTGRERKRTDDRLRKHYEALVANKRLQPAPVTPSWVDPAQLQLAIPDSRAAKLIRRREAAQAREAKRKSAIVLREATPAFEPPRCAPVVETGRIAVSGLETDRQNGLVAPNLQTTRPETVDSDALGTETEELAAPGVEKTTRTAFRGKYKTRPKPKAKGGKKAPARKETAGIRKTGKSRLAPPLGLNPRPLQPPAFLSPVPVVDPGLSSVLRMLHAKRLEPTHVGSTGKPAAVVHGRRVHFMQRHVQPVIPVARPTFQIQTPPIPPTTAINGDHIAVAWAEGSPITPVPVSSFWPQRTPEEKRARKRESYLKRKAKLREHRAAASKEPTKEGAPEGSQSTRNGQGKKAGKKRKDKGELGGAGNRGDEAAQATETTTVQDGVGENARTEKGGKRDRPAATPAQAPRARRKMTDEEKARKNEKARKRWAELRAAKKAAEEAEGVAAWGSAVAGKNGTAALTIKRVPTVRKDRKKKKKGEGRDGENGEPRLANANENGEVRLAAEGTGTVKKRKGRKGKGANKGVGEQPNANKNGDEQTLEEGMVTKPGKKKGNMRTETPKAAQKEALRMDKLERRAAEKEAKQRQKAEERATKAAGRIASETAKEVSKRAGKGPQKGGGGLSAQQRAGKEVDHGAEDGLAGSQSTPRRKSTVQRKAVSPATTREGRAAARADKSGGKRGAALSLAALEPTKRGAKTRADRKGIEKPVAGKQTMAASPEGRSSGRLRGAVLAKEAVGEESPGGDERDRSSGRETRGGRKRVGGAESEAASSEAPRVKRRKTGGVGEAGDGVARLKENENGEKLAERGGVSTRKRAREEISGLEKGKSRGSARKPEKGKLAESEKGGKKRKLTPSAEHEAEATEPERETETEGVGGTAREQPRRVTWGGGDRGGQKGTEVKERTAAEDAVGLKRKPAGTAEPKQAKPARTKRQETAAEADGKRQPGAGSLMVTRRLSRGGVPGQARGVPAEEKSKGTAEPEDGSCERFVRRSGRLSDKGGDGARAEVVDLLDLPDSGEGTVTEREECLDGSDGRVTSAEGKLRVGANLKGKESAADETTEGRVLRGGTKGGAETRNGARGVENGKPGLRHVACGDNVQGEGELGCPPTTRKSSRMKEDHVAGLRETRGGREAARKRAGSHRQKGDAGKDLGEGLPANDMAEPVTSGSPLRRLARGSKRKSTS